jgi:hypothetical protein
MMVRRAYAEDHMDDNGDELLTIASNHDSGLSGHHRYRLLHIARALRATGGLDAGSVRDRSRQRRSIAAADRGGSSTKEARGAITEPSDMPAATPRRRHERRQTLTWSQVIQAHQEAESRLVELARLPDLPARAKELITDLASDIVVPVLRRDGRSPVGRWPSRAGFLWGDTPITELTETELADYKLLLRNRYRADVALKLIVRQRASREAQS